MNNGPEEEVQVMMTWMGNSIPGEYSPDGQYYIPFDTNRDREFIKRTGQAVARFARVLLPDDDTTEERYRFALDKRRNVVRFFNANGNHVDRNIPYGMSMRFAVSVVRAQKHSVSGFVRFTFTDEGANVHGNDITKEVLQGSIVQE